MHWASSRTERDQPGQTTYGMAGARPEQEPAMRRKLVVGNWKMHGSLAANRTLLEKVVAGVYTCYHADFIVCVPYPYIAQAQILLSGSNVGWGAQNLCSTRDGASTG